MKIQIDDEILDADVKEKARIEAIRQEMIDEESKKQDALDAKLTSLAKLKALGMTDEDLKALGLA